jgi:hypothetical protein
LSYFVVPTWHTPQFAFPKNVDFLTP